ncbi:putative HET-domain-containing protein [Seiridium cardinale]
MLTYKDSVALRQWQIIGRSVTTTPDIPLARQWLRDCLESHCLCPKTLKSRLPPRILDLAPPGGAAGDLRLLTDVTSFDQYAALSHCWGNSQPLKLTRKSYEEFQRNISFDCLPKTFQDAVTTTRDLDLRYLWIDSLCILQDSIQDWEEQCAEMKRIYKDAFITIAGAAASNCESGFLHDRSVGSSTTLQVSHRGVSDEIVLTHRDMDEFTGIDLPEQDSPLHKRAWVFQERLLSSRILYFGTKRMYFECFTNARIENCHHPIRWADDEIDIVVKTPLNQLSTHSARRRYWSTLVVAYSQMKLTKISDKLPALSGLASDFQQLTKSRYLAGIWQEDMPDALAWHVPFYDDTPPSRLALSSDCIASSSDYIAPSWSWASVRFEVVNIYSNLCHGDLRVIDAEVRSASHDPFGTVESGWVKLYGKIRTFSVRRFPDVSISGRRTLYVQLGNSQNPFLATYFPDDPYAITASEFELSALYLGTDSKRIDVAMGVQRVDEKGNIYKRVGLVHNDRHIFGYNRNFEDTFRDTSPTLLHLI